VTVYSMTLRVNTITAHVTWAIREDKKKAVRIELLFNFIKSRVFTVLPTASQMNWSQMELTNSNSLWTRSIIAATAFQTSATCYVKVRASSRESPPSALHRF